MTLFDSIRKFVTPIHPEGYVFVVAGLVVGIIFQWVWLPLGILGFVFALYAAYFFRDPARVSPTQEGLLLAPADGKITFIGEVQPPAELSLGTDPMLRISIFLSVFDVHVNRVPMAGRVANVVYRPGKFLNADLDKASEDNERNGVVIETPSMRIGVVQIAGLIARRIVCDLREGDNVASGDRLGIIRFGSRVDVYMPTSVTPLVAVGQRAIGGETVLANASATEVQPRSFRTS